MLVIGKRSLRLSSAANAGAAARIKTHRIEAARTLP
jgi:hypothetical protein